MAPRLNLHDPPTSSSSSSSSSEDSSEESEPEPNPKPSYKNPKHASSSESDSESESESESESSPPAKRKPLISESVNPRSKRSKKQSVSTVVGSSGECSRKKSRNKDDLVLNEILRFNEAAGFSVFNKDNVIKGLELIDESMRVTMENKWKQIKTAEMEVFVRRTQLVNDQANLMFRALKKSFKKSRSR